MRRPALPQLEIQLYDAFAAAPLAGNPAAVVLLQEWLPDEQLASVAGELNAWTAFARRDDETRWRVRIFTIPPIVETALCGHGLLATARCLFDGPAAGADELTLATRDGDVRARPLPGGAALDFPTIRVVAATAPPDLATALGGRPLGWWRRAEGYPAWLALFATAGELAALPLDAWALRKFESLVLATATDESGVAEIASRLFQPMKSLIEDPAGGTQHALAAPFWAARLGRQRIACRSASPRGGRCVCEVMGERVVIEAPVTHAMTARLHLP